jgi:hypothetical protein
MNPCGKEILGIPADIGWPQAFALAVIAVCIMLVARKGLESI